MSEVKTPASGEPIGLRPTAVKSRIARFCLHRRRRQPVPDIWRAAVRVFDAAVQKAYEGANAASPGWGLAGEKAFATTGEWLPESTLEAIQRYRVAIKGPLTTPVGGGIRSLNVTLRQRLDLYACVRPVRYIRGVPSPLVHPEHTDMVIFRENTEDVYAGIEWPAGSEAARKVVHFLREEMKANLHDDQAIGIKPMSRRATQRLVRLALRYAHRPRARQRHFRPQGQHHEVHGRRVQRVGLRAGA